MFVNKIVCPALPPAAPLLPVATRSWLDWHATWGTVTDVGFDVEPPLEVGPVDVLDFAVVDGADAAPDPPHAVTTSPTPRATPIAQNLEPIPLGLLPRERARSGPATVWQECRLCPNQSAFGVTPSLPRDSQSQDQMTLAFAAAVRTAAPSSTVLNSPDAGDGGATKISRGPSGGNG